MGRKRRTILPPHEPPDGPPPATNRAFSALLRILDLDQQQAAEALGVERGTVSDYVTGKKTLFPSNYRRKSAGIGVEPAAAEHALALVEEIDGDFQLRTTTPSDFVAAIGRLAERLAASIPARVKELAAEEDRRRFQTLWRALKKLTLAQWRLVVAAAPDLQRWSFVKLVGEESARAASTDAKQALELAGFTLWLAERISGEEGRQSRVFAWAIVGNARRVGSDLDGALEAFARSVELRSECSQELPEVWRLLDLEASLHIDLRQLPEALRLLDEAAQAAPQTGPIRARLLCKLSNALEQMGDSQGSIAALREGMAQIDRDAEPRLLCMLLFNFMESLCAVGRAAEAERMLPELRRLQTQVGSGLNQLRLRWLEGKIDAGLGHLDAAIAALSSVRAAFADEDIRYDEALAGMELAGLYLEQGRTADVKRLVREMEPVFRAKSVHEEAQKALRLFRRAVELETVTVELVRRIVVYLRRAQNDPKLRFEEVA